MIDSLISIIKGRYRQTHSIFRGCRGSDITFQKKKVMADSFYMVLPSNASLQTFPDKSTGTVTHSITEDVAFTRTLESKDDDI